jgi:hypothetical protein
MVFKNFHSSRALRSLAKNRAIPSKWRLGTVGATAIGDILRRSINTSSIMDFNAPSIMAHEARFANAD